VKCASVAGGVVWAIAGVVAGVVAGVIAGVVAERQGRGESRVVCQDVKGAVVAVSLPSSLVS